MHAVAQDDRRTAERVPYASRVMVLGRETAWFARVIDVSEGGCGIFRPAGFELGPDDLVRMFFHESDDTAVVVVHARVACVTAARVGLEYHDPQTVPPSHPPKP